MKLSVLMAIYYAENPEYFQKSLSSIWDEQIEKPDEIVLVEDGKLTDTLYEIVHKWKSRLGKQFQVVNLETNVGLGKALNEGLKLCTNELIARMDTDDVALPARFRDQKTFLLRQQDVDVVGGWIEEINETGALRNKTVKYPLDHNSCRAFFKYRDPVAHPSVMFRRTFFEKAGCYLPVRKNQDTYLWAQGFKTGCIFANIPKVVIQFRRTDELLNRRSNSKDLIFFLRQRLKINHDLDLGLLADLHVVSYYVLQKMPNIITRLAYRFLR